MTEEHFEALLKLAGAKADKEGWASAADGRHITLHVAKSGAALSIARVEAVRRDGGLVHARTGKGDVYVVELESLFAGAVDGAPASSRKAGFV